MNPVMSSFSEVSTTLPPISPSVIPPSEERPTVSKNLVIELAETYFGLHVLEVRELESYGDRNFYLKTVPKATTRQTDKVYEVNTSNEYVLKILNAVDSAVEGMVEAQNGAMLFLKEKGFVCSVPMLSLSGNYIVYRECSRSYPETITGEVKKHDRSAIIKFNAIRMLSYVPGKLIKDLDVTAITPHLLFDLGQYIGKLNNVLKDYSHSGLLNHVYSWDMAQLSYLKPFISARYLGSKEREKLILSVYDQYISTVLPVLKSCDKQVIHNDISEANIIFMKKPDDTTEWRIAGVIDFGDMCYSYRVFEIAIAMSMIMTLDYCKDKPNPYECVGHVLKGYLSVCPLSQEELDIMYWCVAGRLIQILIACSKKLSFDSENKYVDNMVFKIWDILPRYLESSDKDMLDSWM